MASTFHDGLSFNSPMSRARAELQWLTATSRLHRPAASPHRRAFTTGPAMPEALEPRRLLAGIESGILVAIGTEGADTISTRRSGNDDVIVTTNGVNQQFDMDQFTGVRLEGLGGNDVFKLIDPLTSPVERRTTVVGGAGNDTADFSTRTENLGFHIDIIGSSGPGAALEEVETIIGGAGDDLFNYGNFDRRAEFDRSFDFRLEGRGGNDSFRDHFFGSNYFRSVSLLGGDGDDFFFDNEYGPDIIFGEAGNDVIELNNFASPTGHSGGSGIDTFNLGDNHRDLIDLREAPDVENVINARFEVIGNDLDNLLAAPHEAAVTLRGLGGNDTLVGSAEDEQDLLEGGEGNDSLVGGPGNDTLDGGPGHDTVDGGPGNNVIVDGEVTPAAPNIRIVNRILTADGSWGMDRITVERAGSDGVTVRANDLSQTFNVADFDGILLRGNNGFDHLEVIDRSLPRQPFVRPVTLVGGRGNDTLLGSYGDDVLLGGDRDDRLFGRGGNDSLVGAFGSDFLDGGDGTDTVDGGPGNDTIDDAEVTPPPPSIGIVNRVLIADGSWGVDLLAIEPVAGDDDVIVRVTDTVRRFDTDDFDGVLLRGQQGFDYLQVLQPIPGLKVTLEGGNGYDTLLGSAGEEVLRGGTGNDVLRGFGGNDALFGNGGIDMLDAGDGDDFLDGADGRPLDRLLGRSGTDTALFDSGDEVSGVERFA